MDEPALRQLLDDVRAGVVGPDDAVARLRRLPFVDLGFARVDHHRALRQRAGEAVYAPGKTPRQCAEIVAELLAEPGQTPVLLTRADDGTGRSLSGHGSRRVGDEIGVVVHRVLAPRPAADRSGRGRDGGHGGSPGRRRVHGRLGRLRAAAPRCVADCGVAGVHRLLASADDVADADAVVVVAGMEGALASLVAGITAAPVVAVPVSTGYGAALEGVTALLAMHASCAAGLTVVGIDNGFGAACAIARILP